MALTGKCLCGAVQYRIDAEKHNIGACHCSMCRRFSGGIFIGLEAKPAEVSLSGEENMSVYKSSPWAERVFCRICGSSMFYRITAEGPHQGTYHIGSGTLDDFTGLKLTAEIFTDLKPAAYAFAGDLKSMTEAEVMAMFAAPPEH